MMNSKSDRDKVRQRAAWNAMLNDLANAMMDEAQDRRSELEPTDDFEWLFEKHFEYRKIKADYQKVLATKPVQQMLQTIQDMLIEYHTERNLYEQNPMKYYGLKQSDFV